MVLSNLDIKKALKRHRIRITATPDLKAQLGSCSIDLHLGNRFRVFQRSSHPYIDLKGKIDMEKIMTERIVPDGQAFIMPVALYPGMRICAFTFEEVSSAVEVPYWKKKNNKYAGQKSPLASKLAQEVKRPK